MMLGVPSRAAANNNAEMRTRRQTRATRPSSDQAVLLELLKVGVWARRHPIGFATFPVRDERRKRRRPVLNDARCAQSGSGEQQRRNCAQDVRLVRLAVRQIKPCFLSCSK